MLSIFLTVLSCTALKLADPVALRDVIDTEDNQSLAAWCSGTGCVMPFTPASCLSWCDWNVDKQADAEARGAFGNGNVWKKKQVKATTFNIDIGQAKINAGDAPTALVGTPVRYYFQATGKNDCGIDCATSAPTFPGGDEEKKFSQTNLACGRCYKIASGVAATPVDVTKANSHGLKTHYYLKFSEGAAEGDNAPKMTLYTADKDQAACAGAVLWQPLIGTKETGGAIAGNTAAEKITDGTSDDTSRQACRLIISSGGSPKVGTAKAMNTVASEVENNANKGLAVTYCVSFSGTKFSGVFAPRNCKD